MAPHPMDAQRIPVSLPALRMKLGEASLSTLLRIKNLADEPLRLKRGVQLQEGKYFTNLKSIDVYKNNSASYHLYPISEIPPRTEVVVAARNNGTWLMPSNNNIKGDIVYTNKSETWMFRIQFQNLLLRKVRKCQVAAAFIGGIDEHEHEHEKGSINNNNNGDDNESSFWTIAKDVLDIKPNNEIAITIDVQRGEEGRQAALFHRQSQQIIKSGYLLKNRSFGMKLQWHPRWVVLTSTEIAYSDHDHFASTSSKTESRIALKDIVSVKQGTDIVKNNVIEIQTRSIADKKTYRFAASSPAEMQDWIQQIKSAIGIISGINELGSIHQNLLLGIKESNSETTQTVVEDGFECIHGDTGTTVLPL
jgi:hypothetical protein